MDYKLQLPMPSTVHPVFHVSCLNKLIGDKIPIQIVLSEVDEEGNIILEPKQIYKIRTKQLQI